MNKSFGYDVTNHSFRMARHQVGDFGLHLSLIRSFSWGDNFPVESPYYPGKSLPYHYYFDLIVGILEKVGLRIDIAFNGLSIIFFATLLYLIYKLPQTIFSKNRLLGILSVALFIFHSDLTFIDFFKEKGFSFSTFRNLWLLPDYIHKGPFDGSLVSIFFTLNVYLNQRHFIMALAVSLGIIYFLLSKLTKKQNISQKTLILLGFLLGILSRVHTLTFFSTAFVVFLFFVIFKRLRFILPFFIPLIFIFSFHLRDILKMDMSHVFFNPGFISEKPLFSLNFISFWFLNLGIAFILIPVGFFLSEKKQKFIFLCVFSLFVLGNIFQFSFRIDHNHSLFNFFLIFANFYTAYFLMILLKRNTLLRISLFTILLFLLTASGIIDLMAVKNDFQLYFPDAPSNKFMQWIKINTNKKDVFLSKQEILDPVTFSGRKNYLGHTYYLSVMGYNYLQREEKVKNFFEARDRETLKQIKKEGIKYIVVPTRKITDFNYKVNSDFLKENLILEYKDRDVLVFKL